jgi:hypothetical protein
VKAARLLAFFGFNHYHCECCVWPWGHYDIYGHLQNANSHSARNGNGGTLIYSRFWELEANFELQAMYGGRPSQGHKRPRPNGPRTRSINVIYPWV